MVQETPAGTVSVSTLLEGTMMDVKKFRVKGRNGYTDIEKIRIRYIQGDVVDKVLPGTAYHRMRGNLEWRQSRLTGEFILRAARDFEYWYSTKCCYNCFSWMCSEFMDRAYCSK